MEVRSDISQHRDKKNRRGDVGPWKQRQVPHIYHGEERGATGETWTERRVYKWWVTKIIAAAIWVSVIGLFHGGQKKPMLQLLRHKIIENPCGSCMGDPSAILEGNEMWGQSMECHIYCWMRGFNWSGCRQDIECLHKGTAKKVPLLTHMSSKSLLKGKIQNWASGTLNRDHPVTPSPSHLYPMTQTNRDTVKRWSCSSLYP